MPGTENREAQYVQIAPRGRWSPRSHTLAFCLHGASQGDCDIYVMVDAYPGDITFEIQE